MDQSMELAFIEAFIVQARRERAAFELATAKKRSAFLHRLAHGYGDVLDLRYATPLSPAESDAATILKLLRQRGAPGDCYAISWNDQLDGRMLPLNTVLEHVVGSGLPNLVLCRPAKLVYFEAEQESGAPPRYILERL